VEDVPPVIILKYLDMILYENGSISSNGGTKAIGFNSKLLNIFNPFIIFSFASFPSIPPNSLLFPYLIV